MITHSPFEQLNSKSQQLIDAELNDGEKILWTGRPDAKRDALSAVPIFLFAIPWTAYSADAFIKEGLSHGFDWTITIFSGSFVLIGIGMLLSPLWAYLRSKRTVYAITDKRTLIIVGGRTKMVSTYEVKDVGPITRTERANGSGDLAFAQRFSKDNDGGKKATDVKFVGIPEVRRVEAIMRSTFNNEA